MSRLPVPGSDNGSWGNVLNDFLSVEHNTDGSLKSSGSLSSKVPTSRIIATGTGLSGGGDLSADRTLSVNNDSTTQKVEVARGGTLVGTRKRINFIEGSGVTLAAADDSGNNQVSVTIAATAAYVNVMDYGATGNGSTDDTAAIQAAIVAATNTSGTLTGIAKTVFFPAGRYLTDPIVLPNRVGIMGAGPNASVLVRNSGGSGALVSNDTHAHMCIVSNIRLYGNFSGDASAHGLEFDNSAVYDNLVDEYNDARHLVSDIVVEGCNGDGISLNGNGDIHLVNVQSWYNDGNGYSVYGVDSYFTNCDTGAAGLDGFLFTEGAHRVTNCKAWFSGRVSSAAGIGNGFHMYGTYSGGTFTSCSGQDNAGAGLFIDGAGRLTFAGFEADSNGTAGSSHATKGAGIAIVNAYTNQIISALSWDRGANGTPQAAGLYIGGGSQNNKIVMMQDSGGSMPAVESTSSLDGNDLTVDIQDAAVLGVYGATYTPNPYQGSKIFLTLTGNMTVAAPSPSAHFGSTLTFFFTQDATGGRTVTFNAIYKVTWTPTTTANKINSITFTYNGTNWVQTATATNL